MTPKLKTRSLRAEGGFSLIASLALLVLLLLVAIGILSLSTITVRTVSQDSAAAEARANARLALMMAIGELQSAVGRDERVTSPAGILDADPETPELEGLAYPNLTGVWSSRRSDLSKKPDYDREAPFQRWLVSSGVREEVENLNLVRSGSLREPVLIANPPVSEGVDPAQAQVYAGRVRTDGGAYAWWVGDENSKARVSLSDERDRDEATEVADLLASMATPGTHGVQAVANFENFPSNTEISDKAITLGLLDLAAADAVEAEQFYHDFTVHSESVLADVTKGELRKDLSLFLERTDVDWLEGWGRAGGKSQPPKKPRGPNNEIALSGPKDYDVLSWKSLHHWYNMHRRQIRFQPRLGIDSMHGLEPIDDISNPAWNSGVLRFKPVLVRMQMILSYGVERQGGGNSNAERDYRLSIRAYPVLTLWNPNSVEMTVDQWSVFLHTLPLEHTVYKNGQKVSLVGRGTKDGNYHWKWGGGETVLRFGDGQTPGITFGPGEAKTLTYEFRQGGFNAHNMVARVQPWLPPGGSKPDGHAGLKRMMSDRTIRAKPSDRIAIETKASGWLSSGTSYNKFQTTFGYRCETRTRHEAGYHNDRFRKQMFSSQVCWRRETDRGNPEAAFISKNNFPSKTFRDLDDTAEPFLHLDVRLKTMDEVQLPAKTWQQNIPTHPYVSATSTSLHGSKGVDEATKFFAHPYTVTFEQVNGIEGLVQSKPFFGPSNRPGGLNSIVAQEIPLAPLTSLAQLQNLPQLPMEALNWSGYYFQNNAIGNSHASPGLAPTDIKERSFPFYLGEYFAWQGGDISGKLYNDWTWFNNDHYTISAAPAAVVDRSYVANEMLFDSYFMSSMAGQKGQIFKRYGSEREVGEVVREFFEDEADLPNAAYRPYLRAREREEVIKALVSSNTKVKADAHEVASAYLMAEGGFNINSTSVPAWTAVLGAAHLKRPVTMTSNGRLEAQDRARFVVSRFGTPIGEAAGNGADDEENRWLGYRELTDYEVRQLAEAVVEQVKKRGPFRSLGEFVNRRRSSDPEMARYGALQAALEDPEVEINANYRSDEITTDDLRGNKYKANYKFQEAALGSRYQGTPAYISQADILTPIAPIINARSDTFVIRGYGESRSADGRELLARAWCEAVVQRVPEYLDPSDPAYTAHADLESGLNQVFGRRFLLKSFRWVSPAEVEREGETV